MASGSAPADNGSAPVDISESAAPASSSQLPPRPLGLNFRLAEKAYNDVETSSLPSNDDSVQKTVKDGLALCEVALLQVEKQAIFSSNELGSDINTCDLKYLLLPFYRGELLLRSTDQSKRLASLREALRCLRGFVSDQERLELLAPEAKDWQLVSLAKADPATVRGQKIARLKASKAAKLRLELVRSKLKKRRGDEDEAGGEDDEDDADELEREQHLLLLQSAVHTALDSLRASEQEADMLSQIEKLRRPDGSLPPKPTLEEEDPRLGMQMLSLMPNGGPPGSMPGGGVSLPGGATSATTGPLGLRTVDPWRDPSSRLSYATAMQQIHTGDIPGLYTYSVEEGIRMEEAERAMAEAQKLDAMGDRAAARAQAKVDHEFGNDEEDEEERAKLIKQDEHRDMVKRGSGNRKNRN